MLYADGLPAVYHQPLDDLPMQLVEAARFDGASSYVSLFERVNEALPPESLRDWRAREAYLLASDEALDRFDDDFFALEDAGDVLVERVVQLIDNHPDDYLLGN